jgi:hypothetical protein
VSMRSTLVSAAAFYPQSATWRKIPAQQQT